MNAETFSFYLGLTEIGIAIAIAYWSHRELKRLERLMRELLRFARWTHLELQKITQILLRERPQNDGAK